LAETLLREYASKQVFNQRVSPAKAAMQALCTSVVAKAGGSTIILVAAVPAQLITLILLTNWCYTKMAM